MHVFLTNVSQTDRLGLGAYDLYPGWEVRDKHDFMLR